MKYKCRVIPSKPIILPGHMYAIRRDTTLSLTLGEINRCLNYKAVVYAIKQNGTMTKVNAGNYVEIFKSYNVPAKPPEVKAEEKDVVVNINIETPKVEVEVVPDDSDIVVSGNVDIVGEEETITEVSPTIASIGTDNISIDTTDTIDLDDPVVTDDTEIAVTTTQDGTEIPDVKGSLDGTMVATEEDSYTATLSNDEETTSTNNNSTRTYSKKRNNKKY